MGIFNDGEAVLFGAARNLTANPNSYIHDEPTLLLLREELKNLGLTVELSLRQWRQPDRLIKKVFVKELDGLKLVNVDLDPLRFDFLMECNFVVFRQEVLLDKDVGQLVLALGQNKPLEKLIESLIVDEVSADAKLGKLAFCVGCDAVNHSLEACDADAIVTDVEEVKGFIVL